MSTTRTVAAAIAAVVAYGVGVYVGLFIFLGTFGLEGPIELGFVLLGVTLGTALSAVAVVGVSGDAARTWVSVAITAVGVGVVAAIVLLAFQTDAGTFVPVAIVTAIAETVAAKFATDDQLAGSRR